MVYSGGGKWCSHHLNSLVLVDAQAVHQSEDLFAVLSHSHIPLGWCLLVQHGPLHRHVQHHPFMFLNLGYGQTFRWVQHQHPPDQMLTVWGV